MAGTAKRFETRSRTALVSGLWRDEKLSVRGSWQTTRSCGLAASEAGTRRLRSLFRCGFQEQGIRRFGLPVRPFVRRGSRTEAIRPHMRASFFCHGRNLFVSIQRNLLSSKKKPTCRAASDETPSRLSLPTILNFRYGRLVNWFLHTRRHSPIPKMYYRMPYSADKITGVSV